jgi:hypothetical protein
MLVVTAFGGYNILLTPNDLAATEHTLTYSRRELTLSLANEIIFFRITWYPY